METRRFVHTRDRHRHDLLSSVRRHRREAVRQCIARTKRLDRRLAVIRRVAPGPVRPKLENTVAVRASRIRLRHEHRLACVRIRHRQRPGRRQGSGRILGHSTRRGARDHRRVVHTRDRHRHDLLSSVRRHRREAVRQCIARTKRLDRRLAVIRRVAPGPVRPKLENTVAVRASRIRLRHEHRLACVRIRHRQRPGRRQGIGRIFNGAPGTITTDFRADLRVRS